MKSIYLSLPIILTLAPLAHANESFTSSVGAQVMVRQVLEQNLLQGGDARYANDLRAAIEGGDEATYTLTNSGCEAALGSALCRVHFDIVNNRGQASKFDLEMKIYQGTLKFAKIL